MASSHLTLARELMLSADNPKQKKVGLNNIIMIMDKLLMVNKLTRQVILAMIGFVSELINGNHCGHNIKSLSKLIKEELTDLSHSLNNALNTNDEKQNVVPSAPLMPEEKSIA